MIRFTFWDLLAFFAGSALLACAVPMLVLIGIICLTPALRRRKGWRRTAAALAALLATLALLGLPLLVSLLDDRLDQLAAPGRLAARTRRLASPETFSGMLFPAGSTVVFEESDRSKVESATLPVPATILGLPLVGSFAFVGNSGAVGPEIKRATLAAPTVIHGIPCAAGPLPDSDSEETICTLSRAWSFRDHVIARASVVEVYRSPLGDPPVLKSGVLGKGERLYGVDWPSGVVLHQITLPAGRMTQLPGPDSTLVSICIPPGVTVAMAGAELHGGAELSVQQHRLLFSPVCEAGPSSPLFSDGFATVGGRRYTRGERADENSRWSWSD